MLRTAAAKAAIVRWNPSMVWQDQVHHGHWGNTRREWHCGCHKEYWDEAPGAGHKSSIVC